MWTSLETAVKVQAVGSTQRVSEGGVLRGEQHAGQTGLVGQFTAFLSLALCSGKDPYGLYQKASLLSGSWLGSPMGDTDRRREAGVWSEEDSEVLGQSWQCFCRKFFPDTYLSIYLSTYQSIIGSNKRLSHLPLQLGPEVFPGFQTNAAHFFSMPCP